MNEDISILCLSDTEFSSSKLSILLPLLTPYLENARLVVHLGDGISNFVQALKILAESSQFPKFNKVMSNKEIVYIKGNHDVDSGVTLIVKEMNIANRKLFFYHGQSFNPIYEHFDVLKNKLRVSLGMSMDLSRYYTNQQRNLIGKYNVVVHGHIHKPRIEKAEGTVYFCPGGLTHKVISTKCPISFGVINISNESSLVKFSIYSFLDNSKGDLYIKLADSKEYEYS